MGPLCLESYLPLPSVSVCQLEVCEVGGQWAGQLSGGKTHPNNWVSHGLELGLLSPQFTGGTPGLTELMAQVAHQRASWKREGYLEEELASLGPARPIC